MRPGAGKEVKKNNKGGPEAPKKGPGGSKMITREIGKVARVLFFWCWGLPKDQRSLEKQPCWLLTGDCRTARTGGPSLRVLDAVGQRPGEIRREHTG